MSPRCLDEEGGSADAGTLSPLSHDSGTLELWNLAASLRAERTFPDFGRSVEHFRSRLGIPEPVIGQPDASSVVENDQRTHVLGGRGYDVMPGD